mmetsp:Transcript_86538/g.217929  ORF Transcript_86538/g.217929 Transcript_86538/m.217929 type:complete len:275 (-) Transcript_86538:9-833(-)
MRPPLRWVTRTSSERTKASSNRRRFASLTSMSSGLTNSARRRPRPSASLVHVHGAASRRPFPRCFVPRVLPRTRSRRPSPTQPAASTRKAARRLGCGGVTPRPTRSSWKAPSLSRRRPPLSGRGCCARLRPPIQPRSRIARFPSSIGSGSAPAPEGHRARPPSGPCSTPTWCTRPAMVRCPKTASSTYSNARRPPWSPPVWARSSAIRPHRALSISVRLLRSQPQLLPRLHPRRHHPHRLPQPQTQRPQRRAWNCWTEVGPPARGGGGGGGEGG